MAATKKKSKVEPEEGQALDIKVLGTNLAWLATKQDEIATAVIKAVVADGLKVYRWDPNYYQFKEFVKGAMPTPTMMRVDVSGSKTKIVVNFSLTTNCGAYTKTFNHHVFPAGRYKVSMATATLLPYMKED